MAVSLERHFPDLFHQALTDSIPSDNIEHPQRLIPSRVLLPDVTSDLVLDFAEACIRPGSNIVSLETDCGTVLFDTGNKASFDIFVTNFTSRGKSLSDITDIIITDGHIDHYEGLIHLLNAGIKSRVYFPHSGLLAAQSVDANLNAGFVYGYTKNPAVLEQDMITNVIGDGDVLDFGNYKVTINEVPGHSDGCISGYIEGENGLRVLYGGDFVYGAMSARFHSSVETWKTSYEKVKRHSYTHVLGGHVPYTGKVPTRDQFDNDMQKLGDRVVLMRNGLETPWP